MIKIKETKVQSVTKNTYKEIKVSFLIKPEDYTQEIEDYLYDLKNNGNLGALVFAPTEFKQEESKSELLSSLHFFMQKYSEKEWSSIDKYKEDIYKEFWVNSRTELQEENIKLLIERFKTWLQFNI